MKKKIFTLMIALMSMTIGAQNVCAEPTETLEITLKSGVFLEDYPEGLLALEILTMVNQIKLAPEGDYTAVYSMTDKKLFTVSKIYSITLAPDVSSADDICYSFTNADRETIREADMELYELIENYKALRLHFDTAEPGSYKLTLKSGSHIATTSEEWYAISSLMIIGQLKGNSAVYSSDDKLLFTLLVNEENMTYRVILAPGISSADDIIYSFTDEDRETLYDDDNPAYKAFLTKYKTVQIHFDASEYEMRDWVIEMKTGMTLTPTEGGMAWFFLSNVFHQLKNEQNEKTYTMYVSNLDDKLLFMMDDNYVVTLASGIGPADNVVYTITDEDRMELMGNQEVYPYIADVKTIQLHFITDGQQQTEGLVALVKNGDNMGTNTKAQNVSMCLYLFNQLLYVEEGDDDVLYSLANKKLFTVEGSTGNIILAPGVTSADDIVYTITEEDRESLASTDPEAYKILIPYETVEMHFIVPEKDLIVHLEDGMNIKEAGNEAIANTIELMTYYFYQLHWNYDFDTEAYTYSVYDENYYERELFTVASDGTLTLAPDVTAADNIYYLIEEDMRQYLSDMGSELYDFIYPYKSISMLFGPAKPGDLDEDGRITVDDITLLIAIYLGEGSSPAADVDGDGHVTVDDITNLIDIYLNDGV